MAETLAAGRACSASRSTNAGSVDDSEDYVFEVSPTIEQKGHSRILCDWQVLNDTSTMISLWNYTDLAENLVVTFYWDGGSYNYPVKLNPRQSTTLDVAEIVHAQLPDASGNILPPYAHEGRATLSAAGGAMETIEVAANISTYNVRNATCGVTCNSCNGVGAIWLEQVIFNLAVKQSQGVTPWYQMQDGGAGQVYTGSLTYTSSIPAVATVSSVGSVAGVSPGVTDVGAESVAVVGAGDYCTGTPSPVNCPQSVAVTPSAVTVQPEILKISPSTIPIGGTGTRVTITGTGFGGSPTLNLPTGVAPSNQNSSDSSIAVTLTANFSATIGNAHISVTAGGQQSNQVGVVLNGPAYSVVVSDTTGQDLEGTVLRLTNYHVYNADKSSTIIMPIAENFSTSGWSCTNAKQPPTSTTPCNAGTDVMDGVFQDIWSDYGVYYTPPGCGVNVTDQWQWCAPTGPNPGKTFMTLKGFIHTLDSEINGWTNPPTEIPGGTIFTP